MTSTTRPCTASTTATAAYSGGATCCSSASATWPRQNLAHGDIVEVASAIPGQEHKHIRLIAIAHDIAPGSIGAYYPEANNLCPLTYQDPQSGTPSYKSLPVRLRKVA